MNKFAFLFITLGALSLAACGGSDSSPDAALPVPDAALPDAEPAGACSAENSLCVTVSVPDDYAGTPLNLGVFAFPSLPPAGPPTGTLALIPDPAISAGTALDVVAENIEVTGSLFVYIALYHANPPGFPVPGVDYVGQHAEAVEFGGAAINLPPIRLELAQ